MKQKITFLLLCFGLSLTAQNYSLDNTFSNNAGPSSPTFNGLLINNNYYFFSNGGAVKMDYNGNYVSEFGINGIKSIIIPDRNLSMNDVIFSDGYFYIFGQVSQTSNIFIVKMDENANLDANFGLNGYAEYDFGANESLNYIYPEANGDLFCTGKVGSKLAYFKINSSNGSINYNFDSAGYKSFTMENLAVQSSAGYIIFPDGNKYIIGGALSYTGDMGRDLLLVRINDDGSVDPTYGTNGHNVKYLESSASINNIQKVGNSLFATYHYAYSFNQQGGRVIKYDLSSEDILFNITFLSNPYVKFESENAPFFITSYDNCYTGPCSRNMLMRRYLPDGTPDNSFTFNGNQQFIYSSNDVPFSDDVARFYIVDTNNRILIGGSRLIRIMESTLGVNESETTNIAVYPVPFNDKIFIETSIAIGHVEITDQIGRKILNIHTTAADLKAGLDLSPIQAAGTYFLKLTTLDKKIITKKIIKNN